MAPIQRWLGIHGAHHAPRKRRRAEMVRACRVVLQQAGGSISKSLSDFLVCPLSKKPLRYCEDSQSLISDAIGVSFPIVDGIPCLAPKNGRIFADQGCLKSEDGDDLAIAKTDRGDPHR